MSISREIALTRFATLIPETQRERKKCEHGYAGIPADRVEFLLTEKILLM